jgi:hypothetical protein
MASVEHRIGITEFRVSILANVAICAYIPIANALFVTFQELVFAIQESSLSPLSKHNPIRLGERVY